MYNIKIKNKIIYRIYNKFKKDKKKLNFYECVSWGSDSKIGFNTIKKFKKLEIFFHINHSNGSTVEEFFYKLKNLKIFKIKIKNFNFNEKVQRFLRFRMFKNLCIKNHNNIWVFQQKDDLIENKIIKYIFKTDFKNFINKKKYKLFKKIKPINKIKKKYIKFYMIKKGIKWFEDNSNLKYKNIRNKIRINIINNLKLYLEAFLKI